VLAAVDEIVNFVKQKNDLMAVMAKPLLKMAMPSLEEALRDDPQGVYDTLVTARRRIDEAIKAYERQ
jgi:hypothetical protein